MEEKMGVTTPSMKEEGQIEWKEIRGYEADPTFVLEVREFFTKELDLAS